MLKVEKYIFGNPNNRCLDIPLEKLVAVYRLHKREAIERIRDLKYL